MTSAPVHLWTDSTIVLAWLREHPSKWNVFVANRVSLIHEYQPHARWHHVISKDNPADCASRGISTNELENFNLWWSGPSWLHSHSSHWPVTDDIISQSDVDAELRTTCLHSFTGSDPEFHLIHRYSSLQRLIRVTSFCLRFIKNSLSKKRNTTCLSGPLSLNEMHVATTSLIRIVQKAYFSGEIHIIRNGKTLPSSSKLQSLNPFLDNDQLLRVGGRLKNALLEYDEKFPIILPKKGHFTLLVIRHAHQRILHGGVQATLQYLRSKYWVQGSRSTVRNILRKCVHCIRYSAKTKTQLMGNLPADRVRPTKPFLHSGVDYAGPFLNRPLKGRGKTTTKTYVAVFICFVTRAVHLELVMDLTSEAFIAAFRRFVSRRGRCAKLYSDNATNFVASDKQLRQFVQDLQKSHAPQTFLDEGTEWHFIPPVSPHFGGLWEAAVKSLKYHLRRVIGATILTIEEMLTLLTQVEACLNSRPISALSDDPDDLHALTPGHFLVGESLITPPTPTTLDIPANRLNRWQMVQNMYERMWYRWYKDYLAHLQLRQKWRTKESPIRPNDLVLITDDASPPAKWGLGRVLSVHPGEDDLTRVVSLKTRNGSIKRAVNKLIVLPLNENN